MNKMNSREQSALPGISDASNGGNSNVVTVSASLGENFNASQSQWTLVPQNTLITLQTLPFNLEHIDSTTACIESIERTPGSLNSIQVINSKLEDSVKTHSVSVDSFPNSCSPDVDAQPPARVPAAVQEEEQGHELDDSLNTHFAEFADFSPPIFSKISASLSSSLLELIPGSHSVLLEEVQTEVGTHLSIENDKEYTIIGSLNMLIRVYNKLQACTPHCKKTRLDLIEVKQDLLPEDTQGTEDKGTNCNLLVPLVSSHGREVHCPARYSACLQLLEITQQEDEEDYKPRKVKRFKKHVVPKGTFISQRVWDETGKSNEIVAAPDSVVEEDTIPAVPKRSDQLTKRAMYKRNYEIRTTYKYFCEMCSFKTKRESHLKKHMLLHEKNRRLYPCSQCNFVSIRYSVMRRHEITHSGHAYQCYQCSYKADNAKLLLRHEKMKHSGKDKLQMQLKCSLCPYKTNQQKLYERHQHVHRTPAESESCKLSYQCSYCEYKTNRKEHCLRHITNVHENNRPYLCDLCGMSFKRIDTLAQHKLTHQDRKDRTFPYHCKQCGKGFRSQAHLTEHTIMHSTERPYLCDHCGASFKSQTVQKKHIQTIHLNPRSFNCVKCAKRFNTSYALRRHMRVHESASANEQLAQLDELNGVDVDTVQTAESVTEQEQQALVQDVIAESMEEAYHQPNDDQTYTVMPSNETTTALLYLTSNLPL